MKYPVSKWIDVLPEPYRTKAKQYHVEHEYDKKKDLQSDNLKSALIIMFNWKKTKEGWDAWFKLFNFLKYKDCGPELFK